MIFRHEALSDQRPNRWQLRRGRVAAAVSAALVVGILGGCGDPVSEAEQSAEAYFAASSSGEWDKAVEASTGVAQYWALFYKYLDQIPGVPDGAKFGRGDDVPVTAEFEELRKVDGTLRASGTLTNGTAVDRVDFVDVNGKVVVSDLRVGTGDQVFPISMLWAIGTDEVTQGGITLRPVAGRQSRPDFGKIVEFQWVTALQNNNDWPVQVLAVTLTPFNGEPLTWRPDASGSAVTGADSAIAAEEAVAPGEIGGIWVRQDATTTQGGGTLTVTVQSAGGVTHELSAALPTLTLPEGWQPVG